MTNLGWVVLTATVSAIIAGIAMGWAELAVLGVVAGIAIILAALQTIGRSTYSVEINLPSTRVKMGKHINAEIVFQNTGCHLILTTYLIHRNCAISAYYMYLHL